MSASSTRRSVATRRRRVPAAATSPASIAVDFKDSTIANNKICRWCGGRLLCGQLRERDLHGLDDHSATGRRPSAAVSLSLKAPTVLRGTTVTANKAGDGGGGLVVSQSPPAQIVNSTITGNVANTTAGGTLTAGGGVLAVGAPVGIESSTITGNSAVNGASGGGVVASRGRPGRPPQLRRPGQQRHDCERPARQLRRQPRPDRHDSRRRPAEPVQQHHRRRPQARPARRQRRPDDDTSDPARQPAAQRRRSDRLPDLRPARRAAPRRRRPRHRRLRADRHRGDQPQRHGEGHPKAEGQEGQGRGQGRGRGGCRPRRRRQSDRCQGQDRPAAGDRP